ncbi:type I polyketide synthase [Polyangium mundeleinium]|uniref:SDR family NAD(P)-dependent oxidoreductase n=1 Tax=Polyangium mundeleinium TaxID=2995306 RepID=A0ABT5F7F8_9BACT|nr:type I polyketide synthase [Polyangium mundeleinium]MDC0749534.1 SDR family NAD(P)-dependent oxidoreductase [Polyangium mundeleinium]
MSNAGGPGNPARREPAASEATPLQRAIAALEKMKARLDAVERASNEPIAIIGMGCRFPVGDDGYEAFWQALDRGVDAVREIPEERWPANAIPGQRPEARWAALLDDVAGFDAAFFGISPREAATLDPQQRMLLEVASWALEDAGLPPDTLIGSRTGTFVGSCSYDYQHIVAQARAGRYDVYCATGTAPNAAAGRIAFVLGLQGPAIALDTACSSSLVAVATACQSLRAGESDLALAGGVNAILSPIQMSLLLETQAMSPDGRSKALDARANGFVRGEGCGVVVLKRLSDALRDGDRVHALVRGWAVNQDGRSTGLTTPNVLSQQAMLRQALERARLTPSDIGYVELHGTGTSLGDPIEAEALREVLGQPRADGSSCVLGAVKTNIGHLEGAAGIAGLIKAVLAMKRERIPKNLHFRRLNPRIVLEGTPFVVPVEAVPWPRGSKPRRAGVSSFGISGTNAHVILEEAPASEEPRSPTKQPSTYLLPLSAKGADALVMLARSYAAWLAQASDVSLRDVVHTASLRRTHYDHRLVVVGETREEMQRLLSSYGAGDSSEVIHGRASGQARPKVVFVFAGQGSQWAGMGSQLYAEEPVFRAKLDEIDRALRRHVSFSLIEELSAADERSRLGETEIAQPALFALEVALAELLRSWGVIPDAVIGHSVGEIAAAHVAGAIELDEAARLVALRSRAMQKASGHGRMVWASLPAEEARKALAGREHEVAIAAVNDPGSVVLSGEANALEAVLREIGARGVVTRPLRVNYAFHSPQMEPFARELVSELGSIGRRAAVLTMYSTVTGARVDGDALDAGYWGRNVREAVDFAGAVGTALADGHGAFVEVGPHPVLSSNLEQCFEAQRANARAIATLRRSGEERRALLGALGALHVAGVEIGWKNLCPEAYRVVALPAYPWQRSRYWVENVRHGRPTAGDEEGTPLDEVVYEVQWRRLEPASAAEHRRRRGRWLIFVDRQGLGSALARLLRECGDDCVTVEAAASYARASDGSFRIDPASRDDHERLAAELLRTGEPWTGVIHLLSLDSAPLGATTSATLEHDLGHGMLSALYLAQALLLAKRSGAPTRAVWVTRGAHVVDASETEGSPVQAPLWGFARTLALEHAELENVCIDLDPAGGVDEVRALLHEMHGGEGEDRIALRGQGRYGARLCKGTLTAPSKATNPLPADASFLITGGLGGLGLAAARRLVERGARHIALVGRRAPTSEAMEAIAAMGAMGARLQVVSADVSRPKQVDTMLAEVGGSMPPLRGILHVAGVTGELTPTVHVGRDAFLEVMAPKVVGTWNLYTKTRSLNLDFFFMYSSVSVVLGLAGAAAYTAANAFLDAMAQRMSALKLPGTSVQWGPIAGVGMAARHDTSGKGNPFLRALSPRVAAQALEGLLAMPRPGVVVADLSIDNFVQYFPEQGKSAFWAELSGGGGGKGAGEPAGLAEGIRGMLESAPSAERARLLEERVLEQLGKVLHMDGARIDRQATFSSLGMDSLTGVELRKSLEPIFGLKLPATLIFSHPTPAALAEHLLERLGITEGKAATQAPTPPATPEPTPAPESPELPEDDIEARLAAKLAALDKLLD